MQVIQGTVEFAGFIDPPRNRGVPSWCSLAVFYRLEDSLSIDTLQRHEDELRRYANPASLSPDDVYVFIVPRNWISSKSEQYSILSPYMRYSNLYYWSGYDMQQSDVVVDAFGSSASDQLRHAIQQEMADQNTRFEYVCEKLNAAWKSTDDSNASIGGLAAPVLGFLCIADVLDLRGRAAVVSTYAKQVSRNLSLANRIKWDATWVSAFAKIVHWASLLELQYACLRSVVSSGTPACLYPCDELNVYGWLSHKLDNVPLRTLTLSGLAPSTDIGDQDLMDVDSQASDPMQLPAADTGHSAYFDQLTRCGPTISDDILRKKAVAHFLERRGMWVSAVSSRRLVNTVSDVDAAIVCTHLRAYSDRTPNGDTRASDADMMYLSNAYESLSNLFSADDLKNTSSDEVMRFSPINLLQREFGIFVCSIVTDKSSRASPNTLQGSRFARWHQVLSLVPTCLMSLGADPAASAANDAHKRFARLLHPFAHSQILLQSPYQEDPALYPIPYYVWSMKAAGIRLGSEEADLSRAVVRLYPDAYKACVKNSETLFSGNLASQPRHWRVQRYFGYPYSLQFLASLFKTTKICLVDPDPELWIRRIMNDLRAAQEFAAGRLSPSAAADFLSTLANARFQPGLCVLSRQSLYRIIDIIEYVQIVTQNALLRFVPCTTSVGMVAVSCAMDPFANSVAINADAIFTQAALSDLKIILRPQNMQSLQALRVTRDMMEVCGSAASTADGESQLFGAPTEVSSALSRRQTDAADLTVDMCVRSLQFHAAASESDWESNQKFLRLDTNWHGCRYLLIDVSRVSRALDCLYSILRCARQNELCEVYQPISIHCVFYPFSGHFTSFGGRMLRALLRMDQHDSGLAVGHAALAPLPIIPSTPIARPLSEVIVETLCNSTNLQPNAAAVELLRGLACRYRMLIRPAQNEPTDARRAAPVRQLSVNASPWELLRVNQRDLSTLESRCVNLGNVLPLSDDNNSIVFKYLHHVEPCGVRLASTMPLLSRTRSDVYYGQQVSVLQSILKSNLRQCAHRHVIVADLSDISIATSEWRSSLHAIAWNTINAIELLEQATRISGLAIYESDVEIWLIVNSVAADSLRHYDVEDVETMGQSALALLTMALNTYI